jgi:hypothetical protein
MEALAAERRDRMREQAVLDNVSAELGRKAPQMVQQTEQMRVMEEAYVNMQVPAPERCFERAVCCRYEQALNISSRSQQWLFDTHFVLIQASSSSATTRTTGVAQFYWSDDPARTAKQLQQATQCGEVRHASLFCQVCSVFPKP